MCNPGRPGIPNTKQTQTQRQSPVSFPLGSGGKGIATLPNITNCVLYRMKERERELKLPNLSVLSINIVEDTYYAKSLDALSHKDWAPLKRCLWDGIKIQAFQKLRWKN